MRKILFDKLQLCFFIRQNLVAVGLFSRRTKNHKIFRKLAYILYQFRSAYLNTDFKKWDFNVKEFEDFEEKWKMYQEKWKMECKKDRKQLEGDYIEHLWDQSAPYFISNASAVR